MLHLVRGQGLEVWAQFCEAGSCRAYLSLMRAISLSAGVPLALYSDRHTIFCSPREPTIVEQHSVVLQEMM